MSSSDQVNRLRFFGQWLANPRQTAAITPSSPDLVAAVMAELPDGAQRIIELGAGTGVFTRALLAGEPVRLFNHGRHSRSFTYIDDIVEGVVRVLDRPAAPDPLWTGDAPDPSRSRAPYRLYNIGNADSVPLRR